LNPADFISRLSALDTDESSSMMNMAGSDGFKGFLAAAAARVAAAPQ
jgi:hypothetical protein